MTGNGSFKITDFYFSANDKIVFTAEKLEVSADGHVLVNKADSNGEISIDGIIDVSNISFDIDVHQTNLSVGGDLSFSGGGVADNLYISWGNDNLTLDGSFDGSSILSIKDFYIITPQFSVIADTITLHSSTSFVFEKTDGNDVCVVTSDYLEINGLNIVYGNETISLDTITVTGTLNIALHLDQSSYVSAEDGHIAISGNTIMNIDTTININGTTVTIKGIFIVKSTHDAINIWWNKTEGYFSINCTSILNGGNLYLDINGSSLLSMHWKRFVLNPGVEVRAYTKNGTRFVIGGGAVDIRGLTATIRLQNASFFLRANSFYLDFNGYMELIRNGNETKLSANTVFGYGLSIHGLDVSVAGFEVHFDALALDGFWEITSDGGNISTDVMGDVRILGLKATTDSTSIGTVYLNMSSEDWSYNNVWTSTGGVSLTEYPIGNETLWINFTLCWQV